METFDRGDTMPGFSLFDQDGNNIILTDERGKWIVLFFGPAVHEPIAIAMATGFRNVFSDIERLDARIFGVYAEEAEELQQFAQEHTIPFSLLSDITKNIAIQYGAYAMHGILGHHTEFQPRTYLIDPEGKIAAKYTTFDHHHPGQVIKDLEEFQKVQQA
jgi:peroxiredoxin Q/BCP